MGTPSPGPYYPNGHSTWGTPFCPLCGAKVPEAIESSVDDGASGSPHDEPAQLHDFEDEKGPVAAHRHPLGGGWVAETARVTPTAFVGANASVFDEAQVLDSASVDGTAWVLGHATVSGNARVRGDAEVSGNAHVTGNSLVAGESFVTDEAQVERFRSTERQEARVGGDSVVDGDSRLHGDDTDERSTNGDRPVVNAQYQPSPVLLLPLRERVASQSRP